MGGSSETYNYSTSTHYEPDKVKAAQIEAEGKIVHAKIEQENILLRKSAIIEINEHNAKIQQLMIEAKLLGFERATNALLEFNRQYNIVAEQRYRLLETAGMEVVSDINKYYSLLKDHIFEAETKLMKEELPALLTQLSKFPEESTEKKMYAKHIDAHIEGVLESRKNWIIQQSAQHSSMISSALKLKEDLNAEIASNVEKRMKNLEISVNKLIGKDKDISKLQAGINSVIKRLKS